MSARRLGGQVKLVISGLLLIAMVLLVALHWDFNAYKATWSLYGKPIENVPTIWVILVSAIAGPVFLWLIKVLISGMKDLRATRHETRLHKLESQVKQQSAQAPKAPAPPKEPAEPAPPAEES